MAIDDLFVLEDEMDEAIANTQGSDSGANNTRFHTFRSINIDNVNFTYPNGEFASGPFNEQIHQGELLFIIGGNGSGKSTFLKLLTGLYYPQEGGIRVDNTPIDESSYTAYRSLYSIIFTDFPVLKGRA